MLPKNASHHRLLEQKTLKRLVDAAKVTQPSATP